MAVQKSQSVTPPSQGPLSTRTIERQRKAKHVQKTKENGVYAKSSPQKAACPVSRTEQITASPHSVAGQNGTNVDERLKAARERRQEQQRILASRELNRLEREQKAQQYYQQQLQERKRKLLDQRLKEERRRAAVEEKRKQHIQEEKARYESAVRKTLEKSQRAQQNSLNRGRKPTKTNAPRRPPLTTWERNLVNRLLTPTCSFLNRSRSLGCSSGEQVSCHTTSSTFTSTCTSSTLTPHKAQARPRASPSPGPRRQQARSSTVPQPKVAKLDNGNKRNRNSSFNAKFPVAKHSPRATSQKQSRTASPSPEISPRKSVRRQSTPELPPVPEEEVGVGLEALCPGNTRPPRTARTSGEGHTVKICSDSPPESPRSNLSIILESQEINRTDGDGSPAQMPPCPARQLPEVMPKPSAGTTDREEAARALAERRREARLQREREEQERLQREEEERRIREELEQRRAEERARQQAEDQRLVQEKRRREEEEQRRAEEERAQATREAQLLLKQREEEQARERARVEQLQQQRELQAQKEEAERQVRKKRLEEIMRRTRRSDSPDTKPVAVRISVAAHPKENTQPLSSLEDTVKMASKAPPLVLNGDEDAVPVVAFKERRSLRTLSGLDDIQTQHRAEVI